MGRICRVCIKPSKVLVNIFTEEQTPSLVDKINECANINMRCDDGLPKNICLSCMHSAQAAFKFKRKCEASHKVLVAQLRTKKSKSLEKFELGNECSTERNAVCDPHDQSEIIEEIVLEDDNNLECIKVEQEEFISCTAAVIKQQIELSSESMESAQNYEEFQPEDNDNIKSTTKVGPARPKSAFETTTIDLNCVKIEEEEFISCEQSKTDTENLNADPFSSKVYVDRNIERDEDSFSIESSKNESDIEHETSYATESVVLYPEYTSNRTYSRKEVNKSGARPQMVNKLKNNSSGRGSNALHKAGYLNCPYCPQRFLGHSNLNQHIMGHTDRPLYKCPQCPKVYTSVLNLQKHKRFHLGEKLFKCPHCPKAFNQPSNLQDHLYIHFNNRPFKCPHCPRDFIKKTELSAHISTHRYTYKCPVLDCTKIFIERVELDEHVPTHSLSNGHTNWRSSASSNVYNRS